MRHRVCIVFALISILMTGARGPTAEGAEALKEAPLKIPEFNDYLWAKPVWFKPGIEDEKYKRLLADLRREIDKILEVNEHFAPLVYNTGSEGGEKRPCQGNPGETIITLCWALPFCEKDQADKLKAYIKKEFEAYNPLEFSWVDEGVRREFHEAPKAKSAAGQPRNPHNLYAVWEYVDKVAGAEEAKRLWPKAKAFFDGELKDPDSWGKDMKLSYIYARGTKAVPNLNAHLNGLVATARLARLAGDKETENLAVGLLVRGLAAKHAQAWEHQRTLVSGGGAREVRAAALHQNFPPGFFHPDKEFRGTDFPALSKTYLFFVDLTPELGQFLHDHCEPPVTVAVKYTMWRYPGYWLNKAQQAPFAQGEWCYVDPWVPWAGFLAQAFAMQQEPNELYWYVGHSWTKFGDMWYIQRLCAALRAFAIAKKEA